MNRDSADAAPDVAGPAAGASDVGRGHVQGTRVVLWVTSDSSLDVASLAKHLEAAHGGSGAVTVVSVEEVPANGSPGRAPANDPSDCALVCQHWGDCSAGSDAQTVGGVACRGDRADCTRAASLHALAAIAPSSEPAAQRQLQRDRQGTHASRSDLHLRRRREHAHRRLEVVAPPLPNNVLQRTRDALGERANVLPPEPDVTPTLTLMIASDRGSLLDRLMPRLAGEPDIVLLGEPVVDPSCLLMGLEQQQPRLLLLDKPMFDRLTPQAVRLMGTKAPGLRVLLLCDEVSAGLVEVVLRHRFHGFLLTGCPVQTSAKAIRAVSRGELWLPRTLLANAVFDPLLAPATGVEATQSARPPADAQEAQDTQDALTPREVQVVKLLRQGLSNKEIARSLGVMEDTVKKHLQSVFAKLGVHRRALVVLRPTGGPSNLT